MGELFKYEMKYFENKSPILVFDQIIILVTILEKIIGAIMTQRAQHASVMK